MQEYTNSMFSESFMSKMYKFYLYDYMYEEVSGWGPGIDLDEDRIHNSFLNVTYPNMLMPKFNWQILITTKQMENTGGPKI